MPWPRPSTVLRSATQYVMSLEGGRQKTEFLNIGFQQFLQFPVPALLGRRKAWHFSNKIDSNLLYSRYDILLFIIRFENVVKGVIVKVTKIYAHDIQMCSYVECSLAFHRIKLQALYSEVLVRSKSLHFISIKVLYEKKPWHWTHQTFEYCR